MEDKNLNPENTGKKKFNLFDFFFGWMKSSPKEKPINPNREDGEPKTPEEIEAEEKARKEAKENAPKKGSAWPLVILILLIVAAIAIWQYTSKAKEKTEPITEQPGQPNPSGTQPTQPGQANPGGTQPTQPGQANPGTTVTFDFDQSFDWLTIAKSTQDMLKKIETNHPVYIQDANIILKTEVRNYGGKVMVWLQVERIKGQVKDVFTTADKINIIY